MPFIASVFGEHNSASVSAEADDVRWLETYTEDWLRSGRSHRAERQRRAWGYDTQQNQSLEVPHMDATHGDDKFKGRRNAREMSASLMGFASPSVIAAISASPRECSSDH